MVFGKSNCDLRRKVAMPSTSRAKPYFMLCDICAGVCGWKLEVWLLMPKRMRSTTVTVESADIDIFR